MHKNITIPKNLLPTDGRFGAGPTKIRPEQLQHLTQNQQQLLGTSHRKPPIKNLIQQIKNELTQLFNIPQEYKIVFGNGGATAFWDIANFCLISKKSQHLSFGEFGKKFATTTQNTPFLNKPDIITAPHGKTANFKPNPTIDTYATVQNETSTGACLNISNPTNKTENTILLVDATSAAGGLPIKITETDVYYFSLQKNFSADGGLWVAIMSPKALQRTQEIKKTNRWIPNFLDLNLAIQQSEQNQTNNTPAITTLLLFLSQLTWINKNGSALWAQKRTHTSAKKLYDWAETTPYVEPFVKNPQQRSNVTVTLEFSNQISAPQLSQILRQNGILDTEPYKKIGKNQLRIATYLSIDPNDITALINCIEYVITKL